MNPDSVDIQEATVVDTYGLVLPDAWIQFPVDPAEQANAVRVLKSELAATDEWSKTLERRFDVGLASVNYELGRVNTSMLALLTDFWSTDDTDPAAAPVFVSANCTIGTASRADLETELPLTVGMLLAAASTRPPDERGTPDPTNRADLEPPAVVELPAGRAVRLRRHHTISRTAGEVQGVYTETYLVPHDEAGDRICVLNFGTINDDQARPFSALFEKIAGTLRLYRPGDETIDPVADEVL